MDGVLVLSEPLLAEAASRMFAEKGFTVVHDEYRPFIGQGEDRFIGGVAAARGIPLDPERDKARTYALYLELIPGKLKPLAGSGSSWRPAALEGLAWRSRRAADAIKVEGNLHEIGLPPSNFDAVVTGSDVVRKNRPPDIFLEARAAG